MLFSFDLKKVDQQYILYKKVPEDDQYMLLKDEIKSKNQRAAFYIITFLVKKKQ